MKLCCTICGELLHSPGRDSQDVCDGCWPNFAGNLLESPTARQALDAYVSSAHQMTLRQLEAMVRMTDVWRRQAEED